MWRVRQKEIELDERIKGRLRDGSSSDSSLRDNNFTSTNKRPSKSANTASASGSSNERGYENGYSKEDEELEKFLHSRSVCVCMCVCVCLHLTHLVLNYHQQNKFLYVRKKFISLT